MMTLKMLFIIATLGLCSFAHALPPRPTEPDKLTCQMMKDTYSGPSTPVEPGQPAPPPDISKFRTIPVGNPVTVVAGNFTEFTMEGDGFTVRIIYLARNMHVAFYDSSGREVNSWVSAFGENGETRNSAYADNHMINCQIKSGVIY